MDELTFREKVIFGKASWNVAFAELLKEARESKTLSKDGVQYANEIFTRPELTEYAMQILKGVSDEKDYNKSLQAKPDIYKSANILKQLDKYPSGFFFHYRKTDDPSEIKVIKSDEMPNFRLFDKPPQPGPLDEATIKKVKKAAETFRKTLSELGVQIVIDTNTDHDIRIEAVKGPVTSHVSRAYETPQSVELDLDVFEYNSEYSGLIVDNHLYHANC